LSGANEIRSALDNDLEIAADSLGEADRGMLRLAEDHRARGISPDFFRPGEATGRSNRYLAIVPGNKGNAFSVASLKFVQKILSFAADEVERKSPCIPLFQRGNCLHAVLTPSLTKRGRGDFSRE
jgi:acetylornithine deacetylase/succinyl-diaminopimelate desuccinylase-like protein